MALQLRRGLNSERTGETFAAGELVYTTDTKQLYVGDGTTQGGILVSNSVASSPAELTQNLNLNGFNISGSGNITATAFVGDGSGLTNLPNTGGSGTGVIEGQEYAIDIQGSVRGDDTTVIVDSVLGRVSADLYGDGSNITNITLDQLSGVDTTGVTVNSILKYNGANWVISTDSGSAITIQDEGVDLPTAATTINFVGDGVTVSGTGTEKTVSITSNGSFVGTPFYEGQTYSIGVQGSIIGDDSTVLVNATTQEISSAGGFTGNLTGNVVGNVDGDIKGSIFADDSSVFFDAIDNVMTAFNGTVSNLATRIISPETGFNSVNFAPETGGTSNKIVLSATDSTPSIDIQLESASDLSASDNFVGAINFKIDDSNPILSYGGISMRKSRMTIVNDNTGSYAEAKSLSLVDGNFGMGTHTPAAKLDVQGEVKVGSLTTAERTALTAANGMILYNSDTGEFQAYENGGWTPMISDLGNIEFTGSVIDTADSSAITVTPAVTLSSDLSVENHLTVTGTVTADKFVATGTETPEISASANLNLTAGNAVVITGSPLRMASFTTTERDALAAQNGDVIYNTTDNKFQGYENGAWANLI